MRMRVQAAAFKLGLVVVGLVMVAETNAAIPAFQKNEQGLVRPFRLKNVPLFEFVEAYAKLTGVHIEVGGKFNEELHGGVTLLVPHAIKAEVFDELFHQAVGDNGYSVVDAPGGSGWVLQRRREALDGVMTVYDSKSFPNSHRLVTVMHTLKHAPAENVARFLRTFMPPNSRIIPLLKSQLMIVDEGKNVAKALDLARLIDTEESAKWAESQTDSRARDRSCGAREQKIGTLTVEKLEIKDWPEQAGPSSSSRKSGGRP